MDDAGVGIVGANDGSTGHDWTVHSCGKFVLFAQIAQGQPWS